MDESVNNSNDEMLYQRRFDALKEGDIIYSLKKDKQYTFTTEYGWRCAYSQDKTLVHRQLPQFWYVNEVGDVISVAHNNRAVYVIPDYYLTKKYLRYHFSLPDGKQKTISVHNLCGLVWDSPMSADARQLIETKGVYAIGTRNDQVNGHHTDGDITNNHWSKIEFLIKKPHTSMHLKQYESIAHACKIPTVIYTPYEYDKDGNYLRHGAYNSLQEPDIDKLAEVVNNAIITEILIETDTGSYLITKGGKK